MDEQKELRVIFTKKAESALSDILKDNNIAENDEEFFNDSEEKELKEDIVRDATTTIINKEISEEALNKLLQKHLSVSIESSQKIINDIKSKLLPLLLIYPDEKFDDPSFREEVSKILFGEKNENNQPENVQPIGEKKLEIKDVDKNAEKLKREREVLIQKNTTGEELQKRGPDKYREPIE